MDEFIALYYATRILLGKAQIRLHCEDLVQPLEGLGTLIMQYSSGFQKSDVEAGDQTLLRLTRCYQRIESEFAERTADGIPSLDWNAIGKVVQSSAKHEHHRAELRAYLKTSRQNREKLVASILEQEGPLSEQEIYYKIAERIANELRTEDRMTLDLLTGLDHKIDPLLKALREEGKR